MGFYRHHHTHTCEHHTLTGVGTQVWVFIHGFASIPWCDNPWYTTTHTSTFGLTGHRLHSHLYRTYRGEGTTQQSYRTYVWGGHHATTSSSPSVSLSSLLRLPLFSRIAATTSAMTTRSFRLQSPKHSIARIDCGDSLLRVKLKMCLPWEKTRSTDVDVADK
jgi:hypothetical protein